MRNVALWSVALVMLSTALVSWWIGARVEAAFAGAVRGVADSFGLEIIELRFDRAIATAQAAAVLRGRDAVLQEARVALDAKLAPFGVLTRLADGRAAIELNPLAQTGDRVCPATGYVDLDWRLELDAMLAMQSRRGCMDALDGDSTLDFDLQVPADRFDDLPAAARALRGRLNAQLTHATVAEMLLGPTSRDRVGSLTDMRRSLRIQTQLLLVQRVLVSNADGYRIDAQFADGMMDINGMEYPIPVPGGY
ncbi:MAG: hypothetical protein KDG50_01145 [Chromatiales bacterium]|nr:hypothetical protein [Chromatiales bacterium]